MVDKTRKPVSLILVVALALAMGTAALADYYSDLLPIVTTYAPEFHGKTVILHSNDVHGAIDGYAYMPALRERILSQGASDVLVVDAGDFSQGDIYVSVNRGRAAIDGHSHTVMSSAKYGLPVQSTGTKFAYVGAVVIDNATKAIEGNFLLSTDSLTKDEDVAAAAREIMDAVDEEYGATFATTEVRLEGERIPNRTGETNMGDVTVDAILWEALKGGGIENVEPDHVVGVFNGGSIRATIEAGDVSMKDIGAVQPFGNTVAVVCLTGEELLEALEASTFSTPEQIGAFPQTSDIEWTLRHNSPCKKGRCR